MKLEKALTELYFYFLTNQLCYSVDFIDKYLDKQVKLDAIEKKITKHFLLSNNEFSIDDFPEQELSELFGNDWSEIKDFYNKEPIAYNYKDAFYKSAYSIYKKIVIEDIMSDAKKFLYSNNNLLYFSSTGAFKAVIKEILFTDIDELIENEYDISKIFGESIISTIIYNQANNLVTPYVTEAITLVNSQNLPFTTEKQVKSIFETGKKITIIILLVKPVIKIMDIVIHNMDKLKDYFIYLSISDDSVENKIKPALKIVDNVIETLSYTGKKLIKVIHFAGGKSLEIINAIKDFVEKTYNSAVSFVVSNNDNMIECKDNGKKIYLDWDDYVKIYNNEFFDWNCYNDSKNEQGNFLNFNSYQINNDLLNGLQNYLIEKEQNNYCKNESFVEMFLRQDQSCVSDVQMQYENAIMTFSSTALICFASSSINDENAVVCIFHEFYNFFDSYVLESEL